MEKTNLEKETERKKKLGEFNEVLDATGQENERKAAEAVKEVVKGEEQVREKKRNLVLERLDSLKGKHSEYREFLQNVCLRVLTIRIDWPYGYSCEVRTTKDGIEFHLHSLGFKKYSKGLRLLYDADWDLYGVDQVMVQIENTLDFLQGKGVYGPAKGDTPAADTIVQAKK